MGWSVGFDAEWGRDVGYGVPAVCDQPECTVEINRGLGYVCGGEPYGGEHGCGLYFCEDHLYVGGGLPHQTCDRCGDHEKPHEPKPDLPRWTEHKLTDPSWAEWRRTHPDYVAALTSLDQRRPALPDRPAR